MKLLTSEDMFIFNLLSPEESAQLLEYLKLYAELCAEKHDPEFINLIENKRVRSAFAYFNNRFRRRRPRRKPAEAETAPETQLKMVKLPSEGAAREISDAAEDSRISMRRAVERHCPRIGAGFKPANKEYEMIRRYPAEAAVILLELERTGFSGNTARYLVSRLETSRLLKSRIS